MNHIIKFKKQETRPGSLKKAQFFEGLSLYWLPDLIYKEFVASGAMNQKSNAGLSPISIPIQKIQC
jgi:hypothetical protein